MCTLNPTGAISYLCPVICLSSRWKVSKIMQQHLIRPYNIVAHLVSKTPFISNSISSSSSLYQPALDAAHNGSRILLTNLNHKQCKEQPDFSIGSPCRVQKLVASQPDPLLAKEIFDYACRQPHFCPSSSSFLILILKLGRSKYFSLIDDLLISSKSRGHPITPTIFSYIIKIYGEADLPDKALKTFYTMIEFGCQPSSKQLNRILEILVSHRNFIRPAFDLFKNARHHGVLPNTKSYNILMRAFCWNGDLSIAYTLFNKMFERDITPDVESYRILMQSLCRKNQVNGAVDLLEDMLNKGYVPDTLSYATLLNSLCRKKKLREAYKLLCRMKVKGCNPDISHYNTVIMGFCREGRALDACKILEDMQSNGCLPNLVSYQSLTNGLCDQGMFELAKDYVEEMTSKGFCPHFSVIHALVKGFSNVGRIGESCSVLENVLKNGKAPHYHTWDIIVSGICDVEDTVELGEILKKILKKDVKRDTRIVEAGSGLGEYLIRKLQSKSRRA
ncbi:pentatricopeptide repeat-containing protein At4g01400, mitochondrial [Momordica charantia]|uniref:Pentatricopeptide repeat-containing protein At4g01400, mitochondrial n=1 Tax=Momordica charantia TaxID=3673 RepID=A0A6J1E0K5_MOMCH|nr:pentatricopeptide repeat-containing protein At4g01400, mitochondrial [Momordica charantia]XP_022158310.1 pentatricopeptide repeat-containing protein At4g01400, mitochondrial [Momordica charantia]XP_022158311.1 pentatricopeptide repeat-containing protein At4g01400, mitochondrial [Momordica charantia]